MNSSHSLSAIQYVPAWWRRLIALCLLLDAAGVQAQFRPGLGAGQALSLANGGHVEIVNAPELHATPFTFEAWVRLPDTNGVYTILSRGAGTSPTSTSDYILQVWPGGKVGFFAIGAWYAPDLPLVIPNRWTHIAVSFDGYFKQIYRDGRLEASASWGGSGMAALTSMGPDQPLYLGRQGRECNCNFFAGDVDEVRVWNIARSGVDIANHYNRSLLGNEGVLVPNLVAYYRFDETNETTTGDSSAYGRSGALVGPAGRIPSGAGILSDLPRIEHFTITRAKSDAVELQASVSAMGWDTRARFEYGPTNTFGTATFPYVVALGSNINFNVPLADLPTGAYQARVWATNAVGTNLSAVQSFRIAPPAGRLGYAWSLHAEEHATVTSVPRLTSALTVESWVRLPNTNGIYTILSRGQGLSVDSTADLIVQVLPGGQIGFFAMAGWDYSSGQRVNPNEWTHVAVTYDGMVKRIYLNGVQVGERTRPGALTHSDEEPVYLGRQGRDCYCNFFVGDLDEVRLWNVARTESEIRSHLDEPLTESPSGLLAYYQFDDLDGPLLVDPFASSRHATLAGIERQVPSDIEVIPLLSITARSPDGITISWTPSASGWHLQENATLSPTGWSDSATGDLNPAQLPASGASKFYRLRKP